LLSQNGKQNYFIVNKKRFNSNPFLATTVTIKNGAEPPYGE